MVAPGFSLSGLSLFLGLLLALVKSTSLSGLPPSPVRFSLCHAYLIPAERRRAECRPAESHTLPNAALPNAALPNAVVPNTGLPNVTVPNAAML